MLTGVVSSSESNSFTVGEVVTGTYSYSPAVGDAVTTGDKVGMVSWFGIPIHSIRRLVLQLNVSLVNQLVFVALVLPDLPNTPADALLVQSSHVNEETEPSIVLPLQ